MIRPRTIFVLAISLVTLGFAGCSNGSGNVASNQPPTPTPTPTLTTSIAVTEISGSKQVTGGGGIVLLDGVPVGAMDSSGSFTANTSPGNHTVTILDAGSRGDLALDAVSGASTPAAVAMFESDAVFAPGSFQIPQIVGGVFDFTAAANNPVTMQFFDKSSKPLVVSEFTASSLDLKDGSSTDISTNVTLAPDGTLKIDLASALKSLGTTKAEIAANGPFLLTIDVSDNQGVPYSGSIVFELGIHTITGKVTAPPSNPALPVGAVSLTFKKHSSKATFQTTSASDGSFKISGVPSGQYDVKGSVTTGGTTFNVTGTSAVQSDVIVAAIPVGPADIAKNVVSVSTTAVPGTALSPGTTVQSELEHSQREQLAGVVRPPAAFTPAGPFGNSISVVAGQQDVPTTASAVYTIPKGTQTIAVVYMVCTEEYPVFVDAQSQFNDLWSIVAVDEHGNTLVNDSHNVNEQLTTPPVWQGNGCTALLQPKFDISANTVNSSTTVTVSISATNIGDSLLPTTVTADVASPGNFTIKSFVLDDFFVLTGGDCISSISNDTSNIEICQSASGGDYFSIPSSGNSNTFKRPVTAILDFPPDNPVTVSNVELDVVDITGNVLDTIFNEPPGSHVQLVDPQTLRFSSTYVSPAAPGSGLLTAVPARINFKLTVKGTQGGNIVSATEDLDVFNTLFSAVDSGVTVGRYGHRDLGGDDWATQNTISWLRNNANLVTRFDDISGEHGRNLGHLTHGRGQDVDLFQFTSLDSSSGTNNYNALKNAAIKAAAGDPASIKIVAGWVTDNRAGIDALNANPNVHQVICGLGTKAGILPTGWLRQAMLMGKLPVNNGMPVDLGLGSSAIWKPTRTPSFNTGHNSHVHVTLSF